MTPSECFQHLVPRILLALPYTKMAPLGDWQSAACRRGILHQTSRAKEMLE